MLLRELKYLAELDRNVVEPTLQALGIEFSASKQNKGDDDKKKGGTIRDLDPGMKDLILKHVVRGDTNISMLELTKMFPTPEKMQQARQQMLFLTENFNGMQKEFIRQAAQIPAIKSTASNPPIKRNSLDWLNLLAGELQSQPASQKQFEVKVLRHIETLATPLTNATMTKAGAGVFINDVISRMSSVLSSPGISNATDKIERAIQEFISLFLFLNTKVAEVADELRKAEEHQAKSSPKP